MPHYLNYSLLKCVLMGWLLFCFVAAAVALESAAENPRHLVVFGEQGKFAGWPANEGGWSWGNELLICFEVGSFLVRSDNHDIDPEKPTETLFARSLDGGETWRIERHANVMKAWGISADAFGVKSAQDYSSKDFAMKLRENVIWTSADRGHSWEGPARITGRKDMIMQARTSYIITGEKSAFVFMTAREKAQGKDERKRNRSMVWQTTDGGNRFTFVSLIGAEDMFSEVSTKYDAYSIMPSAVRLREDHYVCAVREIIRRKKWVRIYESRDKCRTWKPISMIAESAHSPAALVSLGGKRLAAIYCSRETSPKGVYAVLSEDEGHTWSQPHILRDDAKSWDFGYPLAFVRPDGAIVMVYYYATESNPEQHIEATIWHPPGPLASRKDERGSAGVASTAAFPGMVKAAGDMASSGDGRRAIFEEAVKRAIAANRNAKFVDASLPLEERVEDLISRLSMEEKATLVHGCSGFEFGRIPRFSIPAIGMSDGPMGVRGPTATKFPAALAMASTWNRDLIYEVGQALGAETMAAGSRVLLAPGVDIVRTPLGGRTFEYFGEDPFLSGAIAVPYVKGLQDRGVGACLKHFVGNNQEKWRRRIDVKVSERALRELYLPPFKTVIDQAGVWSIMGAYNKVNGTYACENADLLNKILKEEWGFDGAVISDWGAWKNSRRSLNGGCTLEMTAPAKSENPGKTLRLVEMEQVDKAQFEDAVRRNLRFLIRCGVFDGARGEYAAINTSEHQALARKVAEESIVLLKNEGALLPLDEKAIRSIAVIGPNADWVLSRNRNARESGGSGAVFPPYEVTGLEALIKRAGDKIDIRFAEGFPYEEGGLETFAEGKAAAMKAAASSDVAIVFAGTNHSYDREATGNVKPENTDKPDLGLIGPQAELIQAVATANPRTIVVLINGAPVEVESWIEKVPALLEAWYPGMEGGNAIANVLFGDVNPSGKLPLTFGRRLEDWRVHSLGGESYPGTGNNGHVNYADGIWVGYRWFDKAGIEPRFPFGHGLSYTQFELGEVRVVRRGEGWDLSVRVTNTGQREGAEVLQLYLQAPPSKVERPLRELKDFAKTLLQPGECRELSLRVEQSQLRYWDESEGRWTIEPGDYVFAMGNSSRNLPLKVSVKFD